MNEVLSWWAKITLIFLEYVHNTGGLEVSKLSEIQRDKIAKDTLSRNSKLYPKRVDNYRLRQHCIHCSNRIDCCCCKLHQLQHHSLNHPLVQSDYRAGDCGDWLADSMVTRLVVLHCWYDYFHGPKLAASLDRQVSPMQHMCTTVCMSVDVVQKVDDFGQRHCPDRSHTNGWYHL